MVVTQLPPDVQRLSEAFVAELERALGPRFVGMFQYGAVCFPPSPVSDFDAHVIVADELTEDDRAAVRDVRERMKALPGGDDMDVWTVTLDAIARPEPPQNQMSTEEFRDLSWALHRAHIHAGRYVQSAGPDPLDIVPVPTWDELDASLQGELGFVRENAEEHPAYGVLNLCRILYSYEMRDVVVGKLQSALWAHAVLDAEHHALIRTALASYADKMYAITDDTRTFFEELEERIGRARSLVRETA